MQQVAPRMCAPLPLPWAAHRRAVSAWHAHARAHADSLPYRGNSTDGQFYPLGGGLDSLRHGAGAHEGSGKRPWELPAGARLASTASAALQGVASLLRLCTGPNRVAAAGAAGAAGAAEPHAGGQGGAGAEGAAAAHVKSVRSRGSSLWQRVPALVGAPAGVRVRGRGGRPRALAVARGARTGRAIAACAHAAAPHAHTLPARPLASLHTMLWAASHAIVIGSSPRCCCGCAAVAWRHA